MLAFDLSQTFSRIRVRGANRVDFLHRMSSGNLLGIKVGEGRTTVFTTPIGRMVDYAVVLAFEDSLLLLGGGNGQGKLIRWLRKYIFFNDDVQLSEETNTLSMVGLFSTGASDFAEGLLAGASQLALYAHRTLGDGILVVAPPLERTGYYLLGALPVPVGTLRPISEYEDLRIRAGYPAFPHEINEDFIPLEAGLLGAVSFTKGCYIGQEIIARMESRGQLAKRLVKIESDMVLKTGDAIRVDGNVVGTLTSTTSDGRAALGYVRSSYAHAGQALAAGDGTARVIGPAGI